MTTYEHQPKVERDMTGYGAYLLWLAARETAEPPGYGYYESVTGVPVVEEEAFTSQIGRPDDDFYPGIALNECAHPHPRKMTDVEYGEWILRKFEGEPRMPKFPPMVLRNELTGKESYEYLPGQEPDPVGDAWLFVKSIDAHQRSVRERLERYAQQRKGEQ